MKIRQPIRALPVLLLSLLLAGCFNTAQQAAQRNEDRCAARGLKPGTDAFADCIVKLETERDVRMQRAHRENMERTSIPPLMRDR
jgi:hypothetical protein